MTEIWNS